MSLLSKLDLKTTIGFIILCITLCALAYFTNQCDEQSQEEPKTLSQQHGVEDQVALWKAMLEEEKKTLNTSKGINKNITHINIDDLIFDEAFALMRRMKGKDATFIWHNAKYTTLLLSEIPLNWIEVGDDINDNFYCPDNYIDECGICGGKGIRTWYVDNDGDGLGDPGTAVKTCEKPS